MHFFFFSSILPRKGGKRLTEKFYTAKYDRVFKTIFCNEKDLSLLKEFLKRVLQIDLNDVHLLRNEIAIEHVMEKVKTVDVFLKCDEIYIHIELNTSYSKALHSRNFSYFTSLYNRNIERGKRIDPHIPFIHLDFTYGLGKNISIKNEYYVMDRKQNCYIKNFKIIEYNMDKIMEFWYSKNEKEIEKYKHLIILDLKREDLKKIMKGDLFMEAVGKSVLELNDEERFRSWMSKEEDMIVMANTEKALAYEEGEAKGIVQGIKQGVKSGIKQGKFEGIAQEKKEIAKKMFQKGINISFISEVTELSEQEIQNLSI